MALSGHCTHADQCPLLGVKRTLSEYQVRSFSINRQAVVFHYCFLFFSSRARLSAASAV